MKRFLLLITWLVFPPAFFFMSKKFGFMDLGSSEELFVGRDYRTKNNFSDKTSAEIDEEVHKILTENYKRAKKIIEENKEILTEMAEILLVKETIYTEEVDMIMAGKTKEEVIEVMDKKLAEQKVKDEARKKEQEIANQISQLETKMRTAEFYLKEGRISQKDFEKIVQAKEDLLKEIYKQKEENLNAEQSAVQNAEETNNKEENKDEEN